MKAAAGSHGSGARVTAWAAAAFAASVAIPSAAAEPAQLTLELSPAERAAEVVSVRALDRDVPQ